MDKDITIDLGSEISSLISDAVASSETKKGNQKIDNNINVNINQNVKGTNQVLNSVKALKEYNKETQIALKQRSEQNKVAKYRITSKQDAFANMAKARYEGNKGELVSWVNAYKAQFDDFDKITEDMVIGITKIKDTYNDIIKNTIGSNGKQSYLHESGYVNSVERFKELFKKYENWQPTLSMKLNFDVNEEQATKQFEEKKNELTKKLSSLDKGKEKRIGTTLKGETYEYWDEDILSDNKAIKEFIEYYTELDKIISIYGGEIPDRIKEIYDAIEGANEDGSLRIGSAIKRGEGNYKDFIQSLRVFEAGENATSEETFETPLKDSQQLIEQIVILNQEVSKIRETLGTVDEDSGIQNLISQFSDLILKIGEVQSAIERINFNVVINDTSSDEDFWSSQLQRFRDKYSQAVKVLGGLDNAYSAIDKSSYQGDYVQISERFNQAAMEVAGNAQATIQNYQEFFKYLKEAAKVVKDDTDDFAEAIRQSVKGLPTDNIRQLQRNREKAKTRDNSVSNAITEQLKEALQGTNAEEGLDLSKNLGDLTGVIDKLNEINDLLSRISEDKGLVEQIDKITLKLDAMQQSFRDLLRNLQNTVREGTSSLNVETESLQVAPSNTSEEISKDTSVVIEQISVLNSSIHELKDLMSTLGNSFDLSNVLNQLAELSDKLNLIHTQLSSTLQVQNNNTNIGIDFSEITRILQELQETQRTISNVSLDNIIEPFTILSNKLDEINSSLKEINVNATVNSDRIKTEELDGLEDKARKLTQLLSEIKGEFSSIEMSPSIPRPKNFVKKIDDLLKGYFASVNVQPDFDASSFIEEINNQLQDEHISFASFAEQLSSSIQQAFARSKVTVSQIDSPTINATNIKEATSVIDKEGKVAEIAADKKREFIEANKSLAESGIATENAINKASESILQEGKAAQEASSKVKNNSSKPKDATLKAQKEINQSYRDEINNLKEVNKLRKRNIGLQGSSKQQDEGTLVRNEQRIQELLERNAELEDDRAERISSSNGKLKESIDLQNKLNLAIANSDRIESETNSAGNEHLQDRIQSEFGKYLKIDLNKYVGDAKEILEELQSEIEKINQNPLQASDPNDISRLQDIRKLASEFESKKISSDFLAANETMLKNLRLKIESFMQKNSGMGREFMEQFQNLSFQITPEMDKTAAKDLVNQFIALETEVTKADKLGKSFFATVGERLKGLNAQLIAQYLSWQDLIRYVKSAVDVIVQLDDALLDLKKTTTMSNSDLEAFYRNSANIAKELGVTTSEIIDQASAWSRLGFSSKEAAETMAQVSSQFASISPGMTTEQAQSGLVSIMKAWDIDVEDVQRELLDNINILGNRFAESNLDIVEGMQRSAAALSAVGEDWKSAFALFTGGKFLYLNVQKCA